MDDLTGFQRDILFVAASFDRPHGLALKAELEEYYEADVQHGRLYPNLDKLVDGGYLDKGEIDKRTNYYDLTAKGRAAIQDRCEWQRQYVDC